MRTRLSSACLVFLASTILLGAACNHVPPDWDNDGDGYEAVDAGGLDCDDEDSRVNPAADERCDGIDNDCNGQVDEDSAVDAPNWYLDEDGDGHGDELSSTVACAQPEGYVADAGDCDDQDAGIHPGAEELCDDVDNDCDGDEDEVEDEKLPFWYPDEDQDGYGDPDAGLRTCDQPEAWVAEELALDCDDSDATIHPFAGDSYGDAVDADCDGFDSEAAWYDDYSYFALVTQTDVSWVDALVSCQDRGYTSLASIQDISEQAAIQALIDESGLSEYVFYIGYTDEADETVWAWADGMAGVYTNWASGEPDDWSSQDCSAMYGSKYERAYQWNDIGCYEPTGDKPRHHLCALRLRDVSVYDDDGDGWSESEGDLDDADPEVHP